MQSFPEGAVLLGNWLGKVDGIEFACSRCSRHGRQRMATLLDRYGTHRPMPEVLAATSADCPRRLNPSHPSGFARARDLSRLHTACLNVDY